MADAETLYQEDFYAWTSEQARLLREQAVRGVNAPLDWANLAEEIESLGRSDRRELASRVETIMEHLLKLAFSPAVQPRAGWIETVVRERQNVARLLNQNRSLGNEVSSVVMEEWAFARRMAARGLRDHGESAAAVALRSSETSFSPDQVLGDWLPGEPLDADPRPT